MLKFIRWMLAQFGLIVTTHDEIESIVAARTEKLREAISALEESYDITLNSLGEALDLKEAATEGHSKRVTAYSIAIAKAMGISAETIRVIARGAFLHDVGKMAIPGAILRRSGALSVDETAIMRRHCDRGYQMIRRIPFLVEAAEIVLAHHENFDGTGYPRGLSREDIPLGARIVAVANTLDSITSDLPYRAKAPFSAAFHEIRRCAGSQLDPEIVSVFLAMPESIWEDLRTKIGS